MYRSLAGFRAQYHHLTLLVVSELNEWKVLIYGPGVIINGTRQFSEAKAKEHALTIAQSYLQEEKHAQVPVLTAVEWAPTTHDDWLVWRT